MKYQFQVDGRGFGSPIRDKWTDAAQDAVNAGYAQWADKPEFVRLDSSQGAAIVKIDEEHVKVTKTKDKPLFEGESFMGEADFAEMERRIMDHLVQQGYDPDRALPTLAPKIGVFILGAVSMLLIVVIMGALT